MLLGDEAIAQGAIDGGISGIYGYPGTPSTEIVEYVQNSKEAVEKDIHRVWSANEKTAMEAALGMSYAGKRSMVCMKHVGLNVAADPFINSSITGVNGGMIVVSADDPSMHSSQNEQDSRFYGKFAMIPILEPSNQQEAYNMAYTGFELSEKLGIPVLIRITTRLSHSRSGVEKQQSKTQRELSLPEDLKQFVLLPSFARLRYSNLIDNQPDLEAVAEDSKYNELFQGKNKKLGIITCGIAYNYLMENFKADELEYPVLKISHYPLPVKKVKKITDSCKEVLVIEEGYPFVEEMLKGFQEKGTRIRGRLDGSLPRVGELNPNHVARSLGIKVSSGQEVPDFIPRRPPALCKGCGHIDVFNALNEALNKYGAGKVFSDIGCYTLGALDPFNSINSCVDMGASLSMAIGAADAGLKPSVAVIGDSTFTHSGMTGLLDAVHKKSPVTIIISDNDITAMTGGQESLATNRLEKICIGLGVESDHLRMLIPLKKNHDEMVKTLKEELKYDGVSVIIARRECIQSALRRKRSKKNK